MRRRWLFSGLAGLLLGSASPPPAPLPYPQLAALDTQALPGPPESIPAPAPPPTPIAEAPAPPEPKAQKTATAPAADRPAGTYRHKGVRVVVSLPQQKAYVFEDGELVATSPVSTGKRGHETPTGTFPITQKKVKHRSNKYANAPMPYMQRLTSYGIALHGGHLPGYPASHGCIRLPHGFAKKLYNMTDYGTRVTVTKKRFKKARDALAVA